MNTKLHAVTDANSCPLSFCITSPAFRAGNPALFPIEYDKRRYKRRNRNEIMFGRLKDWRRVATRYDRCPTVFFSALNLAATVLFWL